MDRSTQVQHQVARDGEVSELLYKPRGYFGLSGALALRVLLVRRANTVRDGAEELLAPVYGNSLALSDLRTPHA